MATQFYTAASADGFIADADHDLEWLFGRDIDQVGGPHAYDDFVRAVGALCMGATTYEWVVGHLGNEPWPYAQPTWVFTHRDLPIPAGEPDLRFTSAPVPQVHAEMTDAIGRGQGRNVWVVGGGELVGTFHDAGLLDEIWVQYTPVTLGSGAPLLPRRIELSLRDVARNGDFACVRYDVLAERQTRNEGQNY